MFKKSKQYKYIILEQRNCKRLNPFAYKCYADLYHSTNVAVHPPPAKSS